MTKYERKVAIKENPTPIEGSIYGLQKTLLREIDQYANLFPILKPNRIKDSSKETVDPLNPEYHPNIHIKVFERINKILALTAQERNSDGGLFSERRNTNRGRFISDVCIFAETIATTILIAEARKYLPTEGADSLVAIHDDLIAEYSRLAREQGNNNLLNTAFPAVANTATGEVSRTKKEEVIPLIYDVRDKIMSALQEKTPDDRLLQLIKPHLAHMHPDHLVD